MCFNPFYDIKNSWNFHLHSGSLADAALEKLDAPLFCEQITVVFEAEWREAVEIYENLRLWAEDMTTSERFPKHTV